MRGTGIFSILLCLVISPRFLSGNSDSRLAPALYVLGDSLLDSGNNNVLPTLARADFQPYGVNFPGGATGRFTNGRTVADFIAEFLGLPMPPPFLSFRNSPTLTGLNYASGSCGILPETGNYISFGCHLMRYKTNTPTTLLNGPYITRAFGAYKGKCLNLDDQIDLFGKTVKNKLTKHYGSSEVLSDYLAKSIFLVSTGSNDYINNYLEPNFYDSSTRYSPQSFAQLLTDSLSHKLERLYKLGARKVVVFEIGPVGCIPSTIRKYPHKGQCVEEINKFVSLFNVQLGTVLKNLTSNLPGSALVLGHIHWLGYDAIIHPSRYGLGNVGDPCCTTWANGTSGCIPGLQPCTPTDSHYFWDAFHLTEAVYSVIAARCINDASVCLPTSIKELVQI